MVDKVRPLKIETATDGTEVDPFPIETDVNEDYVAAKGVALENLDTFLIDKSGNSIQFTDVESGVRTVKSLHTALNEDFDNSSNGFTATNSQAAIEEARTIADAAIFTIPLIYNGTLSGTTLITYSNLTPDSPVIIPINATFTGFTFSNAQNGADYTLNFRNNTNGGTPFYTVSKTNTRVFAETLPTPESFTAGNFISVQYVDNGTNGNDACVLLIFKAVP